MSKQSHFLIASLGLSLLASCASDIKKADIPVGTNPAEAISQTERLQQQARMSQADVLAHDNFKRANEYLEEAREGLRDGDEVAEVLDDSAYAQALFQQSIDTAQREAALYSNILSPRSAAVTAGAFNHEETRDKIKDIDEDLRDESDEFTEDVSAKETAELQKRYLEIEVQTVQINELGSAERVLAQMEDRNAPSLAPASFKKAQEDILLSKNFIAKSPRNPSGYNISVYTALQSTTMLRDVMDVIAQNGNKTPEPAARRIVMQNRKLGTAEENVAALGSTVLSQADKIAFQNAMNNVRESFSEDEAEVYQQGDKLLIRLKKINFPVGKAEVPAGSKDLLARINAIVEELDPSQIEVQGHTDSTGSMATNKKLSQERADKVAEFLKDEGLQTDIRTLGMGPNKPLADNQTEDGRATNRRVDIVISAKDRNVYSE